MSDDISTFEIHRPALIALAYRMLGDMARAEDLVQEARLEWQGRAVDLAGPGGCLLEIVTRLCVRELDSARMGCEESCGDRRPEPVDVDEESDLGDAEMSDQIAIAFLVVLQRLKPEERAVFLLYFAFDLDHAEIATVLQKSEGACCQLLSRARENVTAERRALEAPREEHRQLLQAFVQAFSAGAIDQIMGLLAEDATFIVDPGPEGRRVGRIRNVDRPVVGAKRIAALLAAIAREETQVGTIHECMLNGQPAIVYLRDGRPSAAMLISIADGRIRHIFVQADASRLGHLGPLH